MVVNNSYVGPYGGCLHRTEPDDAFTLFGFKTIFHPSHVEFATIYGLFQVLMCVKAIERVCRLGVWMDYTRGNRNLFGFVTCEGA